MEPIDLSAADNTDDVIAAFETLLDYLADNVQINSHVSEWLTSARATLASLPAATAIGA